MLRLVILVVLVLLVLPTRAAQVRVATNINHLLSLQPSATEAYTDVDGLAVPGDWGGPKRFRWDPTNSLPTNAITIAHPGKSVGRYVHPWDGDLRAWGIIDGAGSTYAGETLSNAVVAARGMPVRYSPGTYTQLLDCYTPLGTDFIVKGSGGGAVVIKHAVPLGVFVRIEKGFTNSINIDGIVFEGEADRTKGWSNIVQYPQSYADWRAGTTYGMQAVISSSFSITNSSPEAVVMRNCTVKNMIGLPTFVYNARRVIFENNLIYKCMDVGFTHCRDVLIQGNRFIFGHDNGMSISRQNNRVVIANNIIFATRNGGISVAGFTAAGEMGSYDVTITGNTIVGCQWAGVEVGIGASLVTITGNTIDLPGWFITPDWAETVSTATVDIGGTNITVASTNNLDVGQWLYAGPWTNNFGELTRVVAASGNTLTVFPPMARTLPAGAPVMAAISSGYNQNTYGILIAGDSTNTFPYNASQVIVSGNLVTRYNSIGIALGLRTQTYDGADKVLVSGNLIGPEQNCERSTYYVAGGGAVRLHPRFNGMEDVSIIGNQFIFSGNDWETAFAGLPVSNPANQASSWTTNAIFGVVIQGAGTTTNEQWVIANNVLGRGARAHTSVGTYPYIRHDSWTADAKLLNATVGDLTVTNLTLLNPDVLTSAGSINTNTYTLTFTEDYYAYTPTHPILITNLVANNIDIGTVVNFRNGSGLYTNQVKFQASGSNMQLPGVRDLNLAGYGMVSFLKTHTNLFWAISSARPNQLIHRDVLGSGIDTTNETLVFMGDYVVHTPSFATSVTNITAPTADNLSRLLIRNSSTDPAKTLTFVNSDALRCPGGSNLVVGVYGTVEFIKIDATTFQVINATR